jgi:hypothetical protein
MNRYLVFRIETILFETIAATRFCDSIEELIDIDHVLAGSPIDKKRGVEKRNCGQHLENMIAFQKIITAVQVSHVPNAK